LTQILKQNTAQVFEKASKQLAQSMGAYDFVRKVEHVARMGEIKKTRTKFWLKILKGKDNLEDWANMEDNIKMDHQEM
jgi:hypothetical protein